MDTMLAAQYLGPGTIQVMELPRPAPGDGEAVVQVEFCGICGSDLAILSGAHPRAKPPLTIGHEICGRVIEMKGAGEVKAGDLATLYPLISCGHCLACRQGQAHVCRSLRLYGFDTDGGMAEFVKVPIDGLLKIPNGMPPRVGAMLEPLAVAVHAVTRAPVQASDTAVVIGAGPIGLLTSLVLQARGVQEVYVTDVVGFRLDLARRLGLRPLDASGDTAFETILQATGGEGADVVFECAGSPGAAADMIRLVRCRGTVVNVSVFKKPVAVDMQAVNFRELTIIGSRVYAMQDFRKAIEIAPSLPLNEMITHCLPLTKVAEAYRLLRSGVGVCKVLVEPSGGRV